MGVAAWQKEAKDSPISTAASLLAILTGVGALVGWLRTRGWSTSFDSIDPWLLVLALSALALLALRSYRHRQNRQAQEARAKDLAAELERASVRLASVNAKSAESAQRPVQPAVKPLSVADQARNVRRINAAKPLVKRYRELFYADDNSRKNGGRFSSVFLNTVLVLPKDDDGWDTCGALLAKVLPRLTVNNEVLILEQAFESFEQSPTEDSFRALALAIAEVGIKSNDWLATLLGLVNSAQKVAPLPRKELGTWLVAYNELAPYLSAFSEESNDLGIPFLKGPFFVVSEQRGGFIFRPNGR